MGRVVHFEIHAENPERAIAFYKDLLQWEFTKWEGPFPYYLIKTGPDGQPGINGGMMQRKSGVQGEGVNSYVCTAQVDNLDESLAKALKIGAALALPKMPVPGVGWLAYIKDTESNILGLHQFDPTAQ